MERSETIAKLALALSKAQGGMASAKKDADNPYFKSRYADLAAVVEAIKEPLSEHELAYTQVVSCEENVVTVETVLMHSSGEWIGGKLSLKPTQASPQGVGSAITYGRRYGLQAIVGVPADDDDGNAASASKQDSAAAPVPASLPKPAPKPASPPATLPKAAPPPASPPPPINPEGPRPQPPRLLPPPTVAVQMARSWQADVTDEATILAYRRIVRDICGDGWGNEIAPVSAAKTLAIELKTRGVRDKARVAAYRMLCDVESGKDMTRAQMLVLYEHLEDWVPAWMIALAEKGE